MTCNTCDTTFEYDENELFVVPSQPNMTLLCCPKCGQQIILVADGFKAANPRIIVEERNEET
jgi:NAD-dependent SIR2 family protein deacetylase